ncbi:hypothetical protein ACFXA0_33810 [Streptomyces cyaneofuscatus]|uniref:hypothetical protein n=1 Tax=Streptomyces cyaneofuscatus TaxID=66883 RepID=UPI00367F9B24
MLCTRCRIRTDATDDGLCTFCSGTRPPLPEDMTPRADGPGGWGVGDWPRSPVGLSWAVTPTRWRLRPQFWPSSSPAP